MPQINVLIFHRVEYGDNCPWAIQLDSQRPGVPSAIYGITKDTATGKFSMNRPVAASSWRFQNLKHKIPVGFLAAGKNYQQFTEVIQNQSIQKDPKWNDQCWVLQCLQKLYNGNFFLVYPDAIPTLLSHKEAVMSKSVPSAVHARLHDEAPQRQRAEPIPSKCFKVERTRTQAKMVTFIFEVEVLFVLFAIVAALGIAGIFAGSLEVDGGPPSWTDRLAIAVAGFCPRPFKCPHA